MFLLFAVALIGTVPFDTRGEVSGDRGLVTLLCLLECFIKAQLKDYHWW